MNLFQMASEYLPLILPRSLLIEGDGAGAARRTFHALPELPYVDLQLGNGAAERIAVHAKLTCRPALIALVFLEHRQNEALFEFTHALGIKNVAFVHLQNECFQLIFHDAFLFSFDVVARTASIC
jgi:hypothetical protein